MLRIREPQMQVFVEDAMRRFTRETCRVLQIEQPDLVEGMADAEIAAAISEAVARGRTYGLHIYDDLFQFVFLQFAYGTACEDEPEFAGLKSILRDEEMDPSVRILQMRHWLLDHFQEEDSPEESAGTP